MKFKEAGIKEWGVGYADKIINKLTIKSQLIFTRLYEQFKIYDEQVKTYDKEIENEVNQDIRCKEIMKIEGIGPLTASAAVATIGDVRLPLPEDLKQLLIKQGLVV